MAVSQNLELRSAGRPLSRREEDFGWLRSSSDFDHAPVTLRERMAEDGYLFLPGFFERTDVASARQALLESLAAEGTLDPAFPIESAIVREGLEMGFRPELANGNSVIEGLLYGPRLLNWFAAFLGGPVRHYDFTWLRAVAPGHGTSPHCDIVYMGRGTAQLYTSWVPLGDVPLRVGGLMILEGSHRLEPLRQTYGTLDVDSACDNHPEAGNQVEAMGYHESGAIETDPVALRERLGGRWLTAEYKMGDLLVFSMFTVHASVDNQSREIRLSSDSRYQLASEPADERWVGEHPIGHGPKAKRSLIC